MRIKIYYKSLL